MSERYNFEWVLIDDDQTILIVDCKKPDGTPLDGITSATWHVASDSAILLTKTHLTGLVIAGATVFIKVSEADQAALPEGVFRHELLVTDTEGETSPQLHGTVSTRESLSLLAP